MFFEIEINNPEELKTLFRDASSDYITLMITYEGMFFVYKTPEIYVHKFYRYTYKDAINELVIRVDKKELLSLVEEGNLTFDFIENFVYINFNNKYTFKMKFQEDIKERYVENFKMVTNAHKYPKVNLQDSEDILKIARSLGSSVTFTNKFISINSKGVFVFKKHSSEEFTVNSRLLDTLRRLSTEVYSVQNYLMHRTSDTCVAVSKLRYEPSNDYDFIYNSKHTHYAKFSCYNLITLIKKLKLAEGDIYVNFETRKLQFISDNKEFLTDIRLDDFKQAREGTRPMVKIPSVVLRGVLNNMDIENTINMYLAKEFVILKLSDTGTMVVFRKEIK